jgi:hypothetical protein
MFVSNAIKMTPCISPFVRIWNYDISINSCFDTFEIIVRSSELAKELVNRDL